MLELDILRLSETGPDSVVRYSHLGTYTSINLPIV